MNYMHYYVILTSSCVQCFQTFPDGLFYEVTVLNPIPLYINFIVCTCPQHQILLILSENVLI